MGAVYLAEDTRLGRQVALKTMRAEVAAKPAAGERFLREARLAAAVEHDHIVPIYHVGESAGIPYLAMPVLKGQSLALMLKHAPKLSTAQVVRVGRQIAEGLAAAHDKGLIHRDIKLVNIWIEPTGGGRVKILDFGLARPEQDDAHLTQSGAVVGTPAYMAPEQARGEKVGPRADLWSLGVVLYELLSGRRPFDAPNTFAILSRIAADQPVAPQLVNRDIPAGLSDLVMRLLEKDPEKRPASAREVINTLAEIEESVLAPAMTTEVARRYFRRLSRVPKRRSLCHRRLRPVASGSDGRWPPPCCWLFSRRATSSAARSSASPPIRASWSSRSLIPTSRSRSCRTAWWCRTRPTGGSSP